MTFLQCQVFVLSIFLPYLNNNQLNHKSIAIRIPKNKFCLSIIDKLNRPLTSTSANLSGSPYPKSKVDINKKIIHGVDYFVETIDNDNLRPSKIIRIIDEKNYTVIRD
jgi:L-threonylcarbamoyladenylate synthase